MPVCGNDVRGFQPAWTLIDAIIEQAKLKAISFAQIIQKDSLIHSQAENTAPVQKREIDKVNFDDDALKDIEKLMQLRKDMKKKLEMKKQYYSNILKRFSISPST